MVITKLYGGLGNQMFQYAIGRHLAWLNNTKLYLDCSFYQTDYLRKYELSNFNIKASVLSDKKMTLMGINDYYKVNKIEKFIYQNIYQKPLSKITESSISNYQDLLKVYETDIYLEGYWQTENYFKNISEIIKEDFILKIPDKKHFYNTLNIVNKSNSVSLHIRRGDYAYNPTVNNIHGLCSIEYYKSAMLILKEKKIDPQIIVFSDDMAWCKENLHSLSNKIYYVEDTHENYEDLYLMSRCQHNIIANSSFSWWAAWLNPNPNKIVIAPQKWFKNEEKIENDRLPKEWTTV